MDVATSAVASGRTMPLQPLLRAPPFPQTGDEGPQITERMSRIAGDVADLPSLCARIRAQRVGGAFWGKRPDLRGLKRLFVLRADSAFDFTELDDPGTLVLLPDPVSMRRFEPILRQYACRVISGDVDPWAVFDAGIAVHCDPIDEFAMLAMLAGTHSVPLSSENVADAEDLLAKGLFGFAYRNPFTGETSTIEETIDILALWREQIDVNRAISATAGIAFWKREAIDHFLWAPRKPVMVQVKNASAAANVRGAIAAWPSREPLGLRDAANGAGAPYYCMEDGFIRSIGLGSNCHTPLSIVLDRQGIYFDATRPSDLETMLEDGGFSTDLLMRARQLAGRIVKAGITKYATGAAAFDAGAPVGRRVVLACGQVEDDLSVRLGGGDVEGNLDLLRRVRAAEPDAFILFKPHPDVDAGHRRGRIEDKDALGIVDRVVRGVQMTALFDVVDAVHVLTSLAGFEALLRGREVVTHGRPFYAGWGLTRDMAGPIARRTRRLSLDELVAAALILYPRYLDPVTNLPCPPEVLVDRFSTQVAPQETWVTRARTWQSRIRTGLRLTGRAA